MLSILKSIPSYEGDDLYLPSTPHCPIISASTWPVQQIAIMFSLQRTSLQYVKPGTIIKSSVEVNEDTKLTLPPTNHANLYTVERGGIFVRFRD